MKQCSRCNGFVPTDSGHCPNCRSARKWWAIPFSLLGASAMTVTLSACYGSPCVATADGGSSCDYDPCTSVTVDAGNGSTTTMCAPEITDAGTDGGL